LFSAKGLGEVCNNKVLGEVAGLIGKEGNEVGNVIVDFSSFVVVLIF
jgi:hypothetical protein